MTTNETPLVGSVRTVAKVERRNGDHVIATMLEKCADEIERLQAEVARLRIGHARYEKVRKLHPRAYADLWQRSISGEGRFDDLVDQSRLNDAAGK